MPIGSDTIRRAPRLVIWRYALVMLGVGLSAPEAGATRLLYEGFDYPAGEELGTAFSATTWENSKRQFTVASGSLEYPGLEVATGNRVTVAPTAPSLDSVRTLEGRWARQTNGTLYVSFLLRLPRDAAIDTPGAAGTALVTVGDTARNTELFGVNLRNEEALQVGVVKYPSHGDFVSATVFATAGPGADLAADGVTTYLIVARYEWVEGASNDVVTLWVNPTTLGGGGAAASQLAASAGEDGTRSAGRITLSRGTAVDLDELRIGQSWAEVTPPARAVHRWLPAVGVLAGGLLAAGLWITRLRLGIAERSAALGTQIRHRQRAEQQRLMEQERARIAQDLHDELGADLTEIGMLATRAQGDAGGAEGGRYLNQVADKSRQMVAKLEEIVWAMNPQHDSLGALVSYFSFLADRLLGLANIKLVVDVSESAASLALETRVRHQLFLVFKEALANVIKHSGASELRLGVRVENRILHVVVADNGRGLREPGATTGGHEGIANMRRRMEKLGGQFEIAGETGQGTTVKFSVSLDS